MGAPLRTVGRYDILQEIGRGGMGIVYTARQRDLDRLVALKELHAVHLNAPGVAERFMRESRLAGSVSHPNIVTVYEYFEEGGTPFIAMEHVPRGSLRPWVGSLSLAQLAGVLEGLLAGLAAVEPAQIVHRDLKPENVMVATDGRVQITDFGIAKASESAGLSSFMTTTGMTVGTPAYMAPEQALSEPVGPWTDLYSVGVMTYEQLVGSVPFHDTQGAMAILLRHVNETIPPLAASRPDVDPTLAAWVEQLVVKDPTARTSSAVQAWDELEEIILRLLGPRWRRDARLPERGAAAKGQTPLTPAPFVDQPASLTSGPATRTPAAPADTPPTDTSAPPPTTAPARAELESGLLAFGRTPTGFQQPLQTPPAAGDRQMSSAEPDLRPSTTPAPTDAPPATRRAAARRATAVASPSLRARSRRLQLLLAALVVTVAAGAGFLLAPTGDGKAPAHHVAATAPQPTRAYALAMSDALAKLNGARADDGEQLEHATTATAQATAAQRLAHAHTQAAAAVRAAAPGTLERTANAAIVAALSRVALGYAAMASAARREDRARFDGAREMVRSGAASLDVALTQLQRLGYKLSS